MTHVVAGLLHPMLLAAGAAAAAIPIIIHLLNRRRVRPQAWAAMQWLLAALKKHQRRLRMENWLILALRVAALALLGLGLSRWVLSDSALAALTKPKRSVVLLLDTSYSTGAKDGARAVSDRVKEEADRVLSGLSSDDVIAVVTSNDVRLDRSGARPALLVPRSVGRDGASRAKQALGAVRPTEAPAQWADALSACSPKAILQEQDVNRVLVWVTDLQAVDWKPPVNRDASDPLRLALEALRRESVEVEIVDVGGSGDRPLPNLGVVEMTTGEASDVFVGHGFRLHLRVVNHGVKPVEGATLRVFLDDAPAPVRTVRVPSLAAADRKTLSSPPQQVLVDVPKDLAFRTAGGHVVRAEVSPPEADPGADSLALDSRRVLAFDVRARLRVVAWVEPGQRAKYDPSEFLRGLFVGEGSGDVFDYDAARSEEDLRRLLTDTSRPPGLVLLGNRVPRGADLQRELVTFVRGGGALIVFSGDDFDEMGWNAAFHTPAASRLLPYRFGPRETRERREVPWSLDFKTEGAHPMSKAFVSGEAQFVRSVPPRIFGRTRLVPPDPVTPRTGPTPSPGATEADDEVVLRFLDSQGDAGSPAIVEGPFGSGRVMYVGTSLDDAWNADAFVYFLPVLLNDGSLQMTREAAGGRNVLVGGSLQATLPRDATNPRLSIPGRGEESPTIRPAATEEDRPSMIYDRVGTAGVWRLSYERPALRGIASSAPRREEEVFGVNPEPVEGSLLRASVDDVTARVPGAQIRVLPTYQEAVASRSAARQGEMTPWILMLVLAVLLLEPYLAMRFGRHDATSPLPASFSAGSQSSSQPSSEPSSQPGSQA